jgi:hypothetical protein
MKQQNVANSNNPYDEVGKEHDKDLNQLVKIKNVSEAKIINLGRDKLNSIQVTTDEERAFVDALISDLPNIYDNSQRPLTQILGPIVTSNEGRNAVSTLDGIVSNLDTPVNTFIANMKQFEDDDIVSNRDLSPEEKGAILTCTSVARFSAAFWSDYLDFPQISDHANADIGAAGGASLVAAGVSLFFAPVAPAVYLFSVGGAAAIASGLSWIKG